MSSPKFLLRHLKPKKWYNDFFDEIVGSGAKYWEELVRKLAFEPKKKDLIRNIIKGVGVNKKRIEIELNLIQ